MSSPIFGSADSLDRQNSGRRGGGGTFGPPGSEGYNHRYGSADAAERRTPPAWAIWTYGDVGSQEFDYGSGLFDALSLPGTAGPGEDGVWGTADDTAGFGPESTFTFKVAESPYAADRGKAVQMTLAGALTWLRNLSVTDKDNYNYIVALLYKSGYLGESDLRFGAYTTDVAAAFLRSVIDVTQINDDEDVGSTTTWFDHIDDLINGSAQAGLSPGVGGSGGGGRQPPTRQDFFTDEDTLRATVSQAAKNALGRKLTDAEEAAFVGAFRGLERKYNDQLFASQMADFSGQATTVPAQPNPGVQAGNFVDDHFSTERQAQDFGSYMGVLRRLVGLGSAGIGGNIG